MTCSNQRTSVRLAGAMFGWLVLFSLVPGCGSDDGGVDVAASKKIAEERGIGPGFAPPGDPTTKKAKTKKAPPVAGLVKPKGAR